MTDTELIKCPACSATNRVPLKKLDAGKTPVCGKCKTPLPASSQPVTFTDANFAALAENASVPVLVDMWAPWCPPCRVVSPIVDEIAAEFQGRLVVGKLNVDDNPVTASRFQARSIPTLLLMKNGREVDRMVGALPKVEIKRRVGALVS
jgi:thioredoxin 2